MSSLKGPVLSVHHVCFGDQIQAVRLGTFTHSIEPSHWPNYEALLGPYTVMYFIFSVTWFIVRT